MNYTADLLVRLQNAIMKGKENTKAPVTKMNRAILDILVQEEMIVGYKEVENMFEIELAYDEGEPVVEKFKSISNPGQRIYVTAKEILPVMNGRGISVISTSKGMMSGAQAKSAGVGGELICEIW
jgi:small subunit ribosomal protein S8